MKQSQILLIETLCIVILCIVCIICIIRENENVAIERKENK